MCNAQCIWNILSDFNLRDSHTWRMDSSSQLCFRISCSGIRFSCLFGKFFHFFLPFRSLVMSSRKYYYYRRPIKGPSETNMPDRRPIGDRHATSETDMSDRRHIGDRHAPSETVMSGETLRTHLNILIFIYFMFILYLYTVGIWRGVDQACQSQMGGMSVSVGSLMKLVEVSDGSSVRHVGLRWVSDSNNIFVNSLVIDSLNTFFNQNFCNFQWRTNSAYESSKTPITPSLTLYPPCFPSSSILIRISYKKF